MRDRAQSETLGFVLVFALIVSSIALVYATGLSGLQDVRDVERVTNAQRAFEVLADNMEDITQRSAPNRATEVKLAGSNLVISEAVTFQVNVVGQFNTTYQVRPVIYSADTGTEIVYVQGAVIRQQGTNGFVVHESTLLLNKSRTVIPIVQTRLSGTGSIGGSGTVLLRAETAQTLLPYSNSSHTNTVWVNMTSPRAGTWMDYLEDKPDTTCQLNGDTASCSVETDHVHVIVFQIDLALE